MTNRLRSTSEWFFCRRAVTRAGAESLLAAELLARGLQGFAQGGLDTPRITRQLRVRLQDAKYTTSSAKIAPSVGLVTIPVENSGDFKAGLKVVLDIEDDRHIQESSIVISIPDHNNIVVGGLVHSHDGTKEPFPVVQPGEKGILIAEWNEYTPTSGIDIAVTSNLTTIA